MRLRKFLFLLFFPASYCFSQTDNVAQRIFLVGDAGEMKKDGSHPVCDWLKQHIDWNDAKNTIVYLGDNIYPEGMPAEGSKNYDAAKKVIDYQISVVQGKNAKAFFVPGNHDWAEGRPGSLQQLRNQSKYITGLQLPNVQVLPANGCPGPVDVQVGDKAVLIFMDSQWWLQQTERPGIESDCDYKTEDEIITALKDIISSYPDKLIIIAMHHPFYTHGKHGGYFTLKQHIFPLTEANKSLYIPLPVIGSIYPIVRGVFGNIQDTKHPQYKNMISRIEEVMKQHPNVVHAAGHEHALQFLKHDSIPYIVSGAGSKSTLVKDGPNTVFADSKNGFATLEITTDGQVSVKFYTLTSSGLAQPIFNTALNTLQPVKDVAEKIPSFPDSVTVIASGKFKSSGFRNFLLGKNYRREWKTPLRVPVIDMGKEFGGLTPLKRGGGHQTKSLRLEDKNGKQYVFRAIEKSVTDAAVPPELRGTIAKDLISDGVSASYPYAALSIPPLAAAVNVPHANPRLVYVPDDPRLGKFRSDFANTFCLIEERVPGADKSYSTDEMADKLEDDNDNMLDQKALLRARLLDMFVMDFDRHEDQWRWAVTDNGKGKTFYPIPRDRDQPFFVSKGLLPSVARKPWISPQVQGFRAKAINIKTYNFNGRHIDRAFMNELNEEDWKKAVDEFLPRMTDELIETSLHLQPAPIRSLPRNEEIIQKLKDRRNYFASEMRQYYRFISKIVDITGSDKKELFDITRNTDGSVLIKMFKITKEGEQSTKLYERKFDPSITKEIRLYGRGGEDKFLVKGKDDGQIKIRMIGGGGNDMFEDNAASPAAKNIAYDVNNKPNQFSGNLQQKLSASPAVNKYERMYYKYDQNIPFVSINFNPDDGLFLGASLKMIRHGFRKTPYKAMHEFSINHALATKAYNFHWYSEFIGALGKKTDLLFDADIKAPHSTSNFFGYGMSSVYDKTKPGEFRYYRARYRLGDISLLARSNFSSVFNMTVGPTFQFFSLDTDDNKNRFIVNTNNNGLDPNTLYKTQTFIGGIVGLNIDNRNNKVLPTRGINWQTSLKMLKGISSASSNVSQLSSNMSLFTSFSQRAGLVIATRFGFGHNFGNFEFYQAQYLGGTDNLRGYRKYRFAGKTMAYNNLEFRIKLADFKTYLFPGSLGLLFFHDIGRVWIKNDNTNKWRNGYGGGLWFSPLRKIVITACYTMSKEDKLPLITAGWQF
ncbi:MAG: BamA/TamA family outer membrane protein [Chitinophagaceae bacterium]